MNRKRKATSQVLLSATTPEVQLELQETKSWTTFVRNVLWNDCALYMDLIHLVLEYNIFQFNIEEIIQFVQKQNWKFPLVVIYDVHKSISHPNLPDFYKKYSICKNPTMYRLIHAIEQNDIWIINKIIRLISEEELLYPWRKEWWNTESRQWDLFSAVFLFSHINIKERTKEEKKWMSYLLWISLYLARGSHTTEKDYEFIGLALSARRSVEICSLFFDPYQDDQKIKELLSSEKDEDKNYFEDPKIKNYLRELLLSEFSQRRKKACYRFKQTSEIFYPKFQEYFNAYKTSKYFILQSKQTK